MPKLHELSEVKTTATMDEVKSCKCCRGRNYFQIFLTIRVHSTKSEIRRTSPCLRSGSNVLTAATSP